VPLLLAWAPVWGWVVLANVLLGVSQGLAWSATVIMKIDLAGPARRGLAMGLNEFAGYVAVGLTAWATGWLASSLGSDTWVYLLGLGLAAGGALLSLAGASETLRHAAAEAPGPTSDAPPPLQTFLHTSFRHPALSSVSQAGLVNNLNDGLAWGLLPVWYAAHGLDLAQIGLLAAVYPTVWGVGQLAAGPLSDAVGRKPVLVAGMWVQAAALGGLAAGSTPTEFAIAAVALGIGTALVYPTFLAAIGDAAHPSWRATAVGTYRLWRDLGYVAGALLAGWIASHWGIGTAIAVVAALTGLSGLWLAVRMPREVAKRSSQSYVPSAPHAPAVSGATETR
jgi:MFS family permease